MRHIAAIEGGATHTRAGLYDENGALLAEAEGGPANPTAYGASACAGVLAALTRLICANMPLREVRVFAALAGAVDKTAQQAVAHGLSALIETPSIWVVSDLHAVLHANAAPGSGILAIAGTGAAILARSREGRLLRRGGWGPLFGDEGSAYAAAASGLRACARALDGVAPETIMTETLVKAAGLKAFAEFVAWSSTASKRDIAALAPAVAAAAVEGDIPARACLEEEARRLAALVLSAQEGLKLEEGVRLFEYGALLEECPLFRDAFRAHVAGYAEMQHMPCRLRGHQAVRVLSELPSPPDWATAWEETQGRMSHPLSPTEQAQADAALDAMSPLELAQAMNRAETQGVEAVRAVLPAIAEAVEQAGRRIAAGGRIIYVGAGTSGRLGALDAAECPPTFGVAPDRVIALIAGGDRALRASVEGAEDDSALGAADIAALAPTAADIVVGIAASGTTPYVLGALAEAKRVGAASALITSNPSASAKVDILIAPTTGPEALAGSTRLKAGSAAKMILNTISTGAMAYAGFVYKGRMIGMIPANRKLRDRAARIVSEIAAIPQDEAAALLSTTDCHIAQAVVMAVKKVSREEAEKLLAQSGGRLRNALA